MLKRRRTEIAKIADPAARLVTFSKRRKGLFKKASDLCHLCGARAVVIVFSPAGKPYSLGHPSEEEIISQYIGGDGEVVPQMGLTEWVDRIENEWDSCATEEDVVSLIAKYESVRDIVRKKLEDLEKNSSVMIGAGGDSGSGLGCNSENLSDQEIDLVLESFKARCPALFEDCLCDGNGEAFFTSPEKSFTGGGCSRVDSTLTCSHLEGCGFNPDNFLNVFGDRMGDGDHDSFLTLSENSAICGGSSRDESMLCDLEGCGFNPDEFLNLDEDCLGDSDHGSFSTLPESLAIGGASSEEESMLYGPEGSGYNPDHFVTLENLDVPL